MNKSPAPKTLLKLRINYRCFPVNLQNVFKNMFHESPVEKPAKICKLGQLLLCPDPTDTLIRFKGTNSFTTVQYNIFLFT